jgi:hypothetical protein
MTDTTERQTLWIELGSTVIILLMYLWMYTPEWKREYLISLAKAYLKIPDRDALSQSQRAIVEKFRREISAWEHEERRRKS